MLGMDPVLTGSLCFLVLAIVMYVKFIREHPMSEEELNTHRHRHHRHSGPVEPDTVPFLDPVTSPVKALQQKKQPLSPLRHHGLAVLQKAHQYKSTMQPSYFNQVKQPMRRRAHSAATNAGGGGGGGTVVLAPNTVADPELGLALVSEHATLYSETYDVSVSGPRSSHRIDFGTMEYDHHDAGFHHHHHQSPRENDTIPSSPYDDAHSDMGFSVDSDLESRLPLAEVPAAAPVHHHGTSLAPAPFMIGEMDMGDGGVSGVAAPTVEGNTSPLVTQGRQESKSVIERPFVRESVPQPAQMQLEVARKARIPLFLHSPMYVKTSAPIVDDQVEQGGVAGGGGDGGVAMTPRQKEKLPPRCHKNNSLHIDFNELKVGDMIGQGAFGTVHKATWRGTTVAVKILVYQYLTADILEEFETEVQIMSILRHPNICLLMGACLEPPSRCLVIEYLPRGSLWNVLRQDHVIDYAKQLTFARDTALGMNYLHSFQPPILHRDLKSPNLLVDTSYAIKISDFGLARVRAHFQTMTGNCGTTQWMAPEVLAAEKYTEKADVFSYGVVCWEIITRACPYDGLCQIQAALGVLNNNLRPTIPANCPPLFKRLMTLCWVSSPEKRPTFEQILELLHSNDDSSFLDDPQHHNHHHHQHHQGR